MNKRNENKPGYKKTKVGWIPEEWEVCNFDKLVKNSQYGLSVPTTKDGNIPILGMSNLQDGKIDLTRLQRIKIDKKELKQFSLKENDLLFNRTNSLALVGKTAIVTLDMDCVFASYLVRFSLKKTVIPNFIGYYFNQKNAISRIKSLSTSGVSQYNINPKILRKYFYIPIPNFIEQQKIAEILSAWDKAIEQTKQLIEAKQKLKKGLIQQLLTGRMRFPEFGKPVKSKGELPKGWKTKKLSYYFIERNETDPALRLLSITASRGVIYRDDVLRKDTSSFDKSKYKKIMPGDIGYNTMRMWQGVSAASSLKGIVSPAYTVCIPTENSHAYFFEYLFKFPSTINLFHRYSQGLVNDTLNLKFHHFAQIKLFVPNKNEQIKIASIFTVMDKEIDILFNHKITLKKQKQGLMQKLLTGEIRVKA
ncbi:MAG: restriction endonuclease subunit S [Gammaproteobacteria bacterium]|jgi:type I restriction enzyme S subunit